MPEPGWLMTAYPPPQEVEVHQKEFVKEFLQIFLQKRQRYQDLEKLRCSVTRTTSFNESLASPLSPIEVPSDPKPMAAEAPSNAANGPSDQGATAAAEETEAQPRNQREGETGEGSDQQGDTQPLNPSTPRRSARKKAADWFRIILNLIRTSKAQRVLRILDQVPEQELRETLTETAKEMSQAFEYQLAMLLDLKEVHKAADYAVSCVTKFLKHKDSEVTAAAFIESIIDRQPLARRQRELRTRLPADSKITWYDSDLFSRPGLRVPKLGKSDAGGTDEVDAASDGDGYEYFFCFTPYGQSCEPDKYGYRNPLGILDKDTGQRVLMYGDKVAMKHKDVCSVKKKEKDGHQKYRPCSTCGNLDWGEFAGACPDHPAQSAESQALCQGGEELPTKAPEDETDAKMDGSAGTTCPGGENTTEEKKAEGEVVTTASTEERGAALTSDGSKNGVDQPTSGKAEDSPPQEAGQGDSADSETARGSGKQVENPGGELGGGDLAVAAAMPLTEMVLPRVEVEEKALEADVTQAVEMEAVSLVVHRGSSPEIKDMAFVDREDLYCESFGDGSSVDGPSASDDVDLEGTSVD